MPLGCYREFAPAARLRQWIECLWVQSPPVAANLVLPDTCSDVIFSRSGGLRLVGTMTRALPVDASREAILGVRFHPGMIRAFFGIPASEITDRVLPLDKTREESERLCDCESELAMLRLLESKLAPHSLLSPVQRAIRYLGATGGTERVSTVCRLAGLSDRQFRRRCLEETGVSPKHLARISRFRRACLHIRGRNPEWAMLAAELGYFDQAHLIHDFREFSGFTPDRFLQYRLSKLP